MTEYEKQSLELLKAIRNSQLDLIELMSQPQHRIKTKARHLTRDAKKAKRKTK